MKILIVGCGSIGRRHAANVLDLNAHQVRLVEPDAQQLKQRCEEFGVSGSRTLDEGLAWEPEAVIVANPPAEHLSTAVAAARRGSHLFIEKPLGNSLQGVEELLSLAQRHRLVTLIGCNIRFHPGPKLAQQALVSGAIGQPLSARFEVGSYLPSWRPGTDFRKSYSARKALGGGCILDAIHEVDLACWFFGWPHAVFCATGSGCHLDIETEAWAEIILQYPDELVVSVHMDYVQRWRQRRCEVIGDKGTVAWKSRDAAVLMVTEGHEDPVRLGYDASYDLNRMYVDELNHFLRCVNRQEASCADAEWGARVLRVALAAKSSTETHQVVPLTWEPATVGAS